MTGLRAVLARLDRVRQATTNDALALGGLILVAFGLGQAPAPWGAVLGPVALGLGLIATVRLGAR